MDDKVEISRMLHYSSRKQEIQKNEKDICTIDASDADAYGVRAYMSVPFRKNFKKPCNELKLTAQPWEGMLQKLDARWWGTDKH